MAKVNISNWTAEITSLDVNRETDALISNNALLVFNYVMLAVVCQIIAVFGVGGNIINVFCFVKHGFKESVNVSLLGLAISDLGCLVTVIWTNICFTPAFSQADMPFDPIEVTYLTGGIPHTTFTRVTGWITALITLERCLCIAAPLKVKAIIRPTRVSIAITFIFIILIVSVSPMYLVYGLRERFFPERNKTMLGISFQTNRQSIERASFLVNNVSIPFTAFAIIIVCTVILVVTLRKKSEWRKKSAVKGQADSVSHRNQKVAKMVVIISAMFIFCFVPLSVIFITMSLDSKFAFDGKYRNVVVLLGGTGFVLESINSSVNIFIYYGMSSRYRNTFRQLFCLPSK